MYCQDCGVEAPTKYVSFHQNIGALVIRFPKSVEGNLCKSCIHRHFWAMTTTTLFLGWWGTISLIVTPFFILNNVFRYLFCLGMPAVPPGATSPQLTDEVIERLKPHVQQIFERLNHDEKFETVIEATALNAGVTPGQVALFVHAIVQAHQQQPQS